MAAAIFLMIVIVVFTIRAIWITKKHKSHRHVTVALVHPIRSPSAVEFW